MLTIFSGTLWVTIAPVTAEVVGLKELPSALSIICKFSSPFRLLPSIYTSLRDRHLNSVRYRPQRWVAAANSSCSTTFSEPIGLEIVQHTGHYLGAQVFSGLMYVAAAICLWFLKAWKVKQLENAVVEKALGSSESVGHTKHTGHESSFLKRMLHWYVV